MTGWPATLSTYAVRHAATVGRRAIQPVDTWIPHLPQAEGKLLGVIRGPEQSRNYFMSVAFTPDCRRVVLAHGDSRASSWDLATGHRIWQRDEAIGCDLALSPDGARGAVSRLDARLRILDVVTGLLLTTCEGHPTEVEYASWSPDARRVVSCNLNSPGPYELRIWDTVTGECLVVCTGIERGIVRVDWSSCGRFVASGTESPSDIRIWDPNTGNCLHRWEPYQKGVWGLRWAPDNRLLVVSYTDGVVLLLDANTGSIRHWLREQVAQRSGASGLAWSPDGRRVAAGFRDKDRSIRVWDVETGEEMERFAYPEDCIGLAWSHNGAFLGSAHFNNVFRFWDVRHLAATPTPQGATSEETPVPLHGELRLLPSALARLLRLGIHPPLSLVRDLIAEIGRQPDTACAELRRDLRPLADLRWPADARIGLVALLLHQLPLRGWSPPPGVSPTEVRDAVAVALRGAEIPAEAPTPPVALLRQAAGEIDDRLLSLLTLVGPEAVAADPALPLRLLPRVGAMPALNTKQRQLLGVRARVEGRSGRSTGLRAGLDRMVAGGIEMGRLSARRRFLLPTQIVMPGVLRRARHLRGELLFRVREAAAPPRLRPTVITLDVSPPTYGPVEAVTRLAAFIVAQTLREAGVPVVLVTPDEPADTILPLERASDLVEVWTRRTLAPVDAGRLLRTAGAVRAALQDGGSPDAAVLLLTHCWFAAEKSLPEIPFLRALFVRHPGRDVVPPAAVHCQVHRRLPSASTTALSRILGELLA